MSYYHTCPDCGDNLDPGEHCDCRKQSKNKNFIIGLDLSNSTDFTAITATRNIIGDACNIITQAPEGKIKHIL